MARSGNPSSYVRIEGDIAYVELTQGKTAIIDAADAEAVGRHPWYLHKKGYAVTTNNGGRGPKKIRLHRFLLGPGQPDIDHENTDKLDNRRSNLRPCTNAENQHNQRIRTHHADGKPFSCEFKGVYWHKRDKRYRAKITLHNKRHDLGSFKNPIDAGLAYDRAAREMYGEFAHTNFGRKL
jgi:hypothetical protein